MTIAALRRLLDEIDTQGGPEAARHNRLHLPDDEGAQPMDTGIAPSPNQIAARPPRTAQEEAESLPVGQLLTWGHQHQDPEVQDQAARVAAGLAGLRQRYATDLELSAITSEAEQLEKRLAELRAREQELVPAKAKKPRKPVGYPAAEVRAWAAANGHDCPPVGRVPKAIVEAWRAATGQTAA